MDFRLPVPLHGGVGDLATDVQRGRFGLREVG